MRNPWDRFISGWRYCASTKDRPLLDVLENPPQDGHDYRHLTRPQHTILCDETGTLVTDVLLRFETLQRDYDDLCERIGKPRATLPRLSVSGREGYRQFYDDRTRELVAVRYARDVELFGYAFEERQPQRESLWGRARRFISG